MSWRVTQYDQHGGFMHSKTYRWRWWAVLVAWTMAGPGLNGSTYHTELEEVS